MNKLNEKLFEKNSEVSKREMTSLIGGANNSDKTYTDTKKDGANSYDIAVLSLSDVINTSTSLDKPAS